MVNKYITPAYGIPGRFKTPEQVHQDRLAKLKGQAVGGTESWIPGGDFLNTLALSTASSFVSGLAGDAKSLDYIFDSDITKGAAHSLRSISSAINAKKPEIAHLAAQKTFVHDDGTLGAAWGDIYAYAELAGSGLGSIAAMILGGGALKMVAKGGIRALTSRAVRKKTDDLIAANKNMTREMAEKKARSQVTDYAKKYDSALGTAAYGTAEMAIVSGSVGMSIEEEVMRAPAKIINQSDRFRELYYDLIDNEGLTHDAAHNSARIKLSREAGIEGAKQVAIPSLLLGAVAGRYIDKAITGRLTKSTLANFGILEAIEVPTEMLQGGTEQFVQNRVYKELIDKQRNVWAGVPDSAIREGLGVAFGVAPLALVSAKAEADLAAGVPPSTDRLTEEEELTLVDAAYKVDEAATDELLGRTHDDPVARFEGLMEIINTGNQGRPAAEESVDLDLDLDEDALAEIEAEDAAGAEQDGSQPSPEELVNLGADIAEEPSELQIEADNYKKAHPKYEGLQLSLENKPGDMRGGREQAHYYGDIKGTEGADGDAVDVILNRDNDPEADTPVFIINQINPDTGKFDEHKVMLGFTTAAEAEQGYRDNYDPNWKGFKSIHEMSIDGFKEWLKGDTKNEFTEPEGGIAPEPAPPVETPVEGDIAPPPPVEAPEGDITPEPEGAAPEPAPAPAAEGELPAHKVDFDTFRTGKASGTYAPEPAQTAAATGAFQIGTKQDSVDLDSPSTLERVEANALGKALGIKTITSRDSLNNRLNAVALFTNDPTAAALEGINQYLKNPYRLQAMKQDEILDAAIDLSKTMANAANEIYDRQQHREIIEAAVAAGDFTLEDFNALPEADQTAYADIGKQLRADTAPAPEGDVAPPGTGKPETPEVPEGVAPDAGEVETPAPDEEDGGETAPDDDTGGDKPEPTEGDTRPDIPKPTPEPEAEPTPEEIEAQEVKEAADIAAREAIQLALDDLKPESKIIVRGVTLSGDKTMNPETIEFMGSGDDVYRFKKGKNERRNIILSDGVFYLTSLSGKRSKKITEIERKKVLKKDQDEESESIIRRPHELWKKHQTFDSAEEKLKQISAAVSHGNYIKSVNYKDKTHGVKRMYADLLSHVPPFLKWLAPHIGSEHGGVKPKDAVLAILRNQPLTQFRDTKKVNVQTPEELDDLVDDYVAMMKRFQDLVIGSDNIRELRNVYARTEFMQEMPEDAANPPIDSVLELSDDDYGIRYRDWARTYNHVKRRELAKTIIPKIKSEGSIYTDYPEMFPKISYHEIYSDYSSQIQNDSVSDEKLKAEVPRQRQKLTVLAAARHGMPDHRKGKNITRNDLMDTFAFVDVVYGDWVSDLAIEGEISERQQYRNLVYDSFADLAYLTGLPLKVMGKNLYLSLGRLGHGKKTGLAFFSPSYNKISITADDTEDNIRDLRTILDDNDVYYSIDESVKSLFKKVGEVVSAGDANLEQIRIIQFTRGEGNGAFAHEWSHNLGNILKELETGMAESLQKRPSVFGLHRAVKRAIRQYISGKSTYYDEEELIQNLRDNLESSLNSTTEFIKPTQYMKSAEFMEIRAGKPGRKYWSTTWEMYARAIEAYIHDAITAEGDGAANPFLQSPKAADGNISTATGYLAPIYPEGEERQYFNSLLKQMFADIKSTDEGDVAFDQDGEEYNLKFGIQAEFDKIKKDYLDNLDAMIEQAREDRLEALLAEDDDAEENIAENLADDDIIAGIEEALAGKLEDQPDPTPRTGRRSGGAPGPRRPRGGDDAPGLGGGSRKPKNIDDVISGLAGAGMPLNDHDRGIVDDLMKGEESDSTRFSISLEDFGDTRFSVENVQERNPDLDPELYAKIAGFLSRRYAQFRDAGNRNIQDFFRQMADKAEPLMTKYQPYFVQFIKDIRDGNINYRDYVDADSEGGEQAGEGATDSPDSEGQDDGTGVSEPTDKQTDTDDDAGAGAAGAVETPSTGEGRDGATDLDNAGDNAYSGLDPAELSERIQAETGLRSPSVEPLPSNLGINKAQIPKVPIARVRDYESEYQVPTSMSENMENAVLRLSDLVTAGDEYTDLDDYVMKQLGYDSQEVFDNAFMSLQVEAIAAAIYQMEHRNKSVIIADQTGVGKGRQAGGLIRWAIKQGKIPVFVTENDGLYTDMYYDMVDSGTDTVVPFITNTDGGVKSRDIDEDEAAQLEHDEKKIPMLHKIPGKQTMANLTAMAKTGKMPAGANVIFTTYKQLDRTGVRRDALSKLTENNDVVLILDESHQASKYNQITPRNPSEKRNNFFTRIIKQSWGTTYLSATFAKNPENLAFYFNTDLSDAMDDMQQLVEVLKSGGVQLQEVMSRALTRSGQLFRREISYEGIDIRTEFNDKNKTRDRGYINKLTTVIQALIPINHAIIRELNAEYVTDPNPMGVASILFNRQEINETEYKRIEQGVADGKEIRISFTPLANQIHNLTDQILVASKADLAVDAILDDIQAGQKPLIGLDKTNMAMLHEYITRTNKVVGDDMSDLNWSGLLKFWSQKSFNVSISVGPNPKESERIRGNLGENVQGVDAENITALHGVDAMAEKLLSDIDLPLSPIDYITQKAEARAKTELGKNIVIKEITGRYAGDYGIDYTGEKPVLYKVKRFEKRSVIDAFNGEVKDANSNKIPSTVDGIILNQSGAIGVSLHSSEKHGDRKIRHMTILEPAGDINVFQQMLGRIFRTGMGDTYPLYTVLASAIPSDARKINVLRKKMESLNAQTSSNREGAAGVAVEDIMNTYGNDVVRTWVESNQEFQELFENWETKIGHEKGLAYWVTGKISLFSFEYQEIFYKEVSEMFNAAVEQAKADGTYTLEEAFYDWKAVYMEEITIAEPRKEGTGFNEGSFMVRFDAETDFKAMTPDEVAAGIEEGKAINIDPNADKVKAIFDLNMNLKDSNFKEIEELAQDDPKTMSQMVFDRYKQNLRQMYGAAVREIIGDENLSDEQQRAGYSSINEERIESYREILKEQRENVRNSLPKGGKTKFDDLERSLNRAVKTALNKVAQTKIMKRMVVGKTYSLSIGEGDNKFNTIGTVLSYARLNNTVDPYVLGDIEIRIAANKPGGTNSSGVITRTLGQISGWQVSPVREWAGYRDPDIDQVLTKYHDTLATTSSIVTEWVAVGNPLIAASEIIPTGEYIQFSDKYGRRMFGIRMPKGAVDDGIEAMIRGNLEIPSGSVIANYIKENPHSRLSREIGFRTRSQNVIILLDREVPDSIRFKFETSALDKVNDPELLKMLEKIGVQVHRFDDTETIEFTVEFNDATAVLNQLMRRSRLVVLGSEKYQLKNYMNIGQSIKAGENIISTINPADVENYVFERDGSVITAHRGTYKTNAQKAQGEKGYDGFYMEGLPRFFNLETIARLTMMKGRDGGEHQDRPFIRIEEFVRGNVQNGRDGRKGLGKPVLGRSTKKDGTSFKLGLGEKPKVTVAAAQASLDGLPKRLSKLVKVVKNESDLPLKVRLKINARKINGQVKGVYHEGKIYIVADGLLTANQAMIVFLHEGVGHLGLRKLMGEDLKSLLDQVGTLYPEQMRDLAEKYNVDISGDEGWYEIAEEVVAHIAEKGDNRSLINRIVALFRQLMRKLGFSLVLNENDVRAILAAARKSIAAGGFDIGVNIVQPTPMFSIQSKTADTTDSPPEDTVIQGIKDGQPVDAIFRGLWGIAELTQIPKLVKFTSASTLRGAMNFYDNHMEWAHPAMNYMAKGLIDQYGLSDEYKQLRASMASMKAGIIDEVRDIIEVMQGMSVTDEDATMIHEILTNEEPRTEAWDAVTEPIRKRVEELGQKAVDLNLISQESYDRNKGMYLHRVYMKYEMNRSGLQKWADNLSGKRKAKIKGHETMERGKSIFIKMDRILADTGLTKGELISGGQGATIYKVDEMSANGQKSLRTYYSLQPFNQEGFSSEEFTVRAVHAGRVKLHRDWTKAERKDMGQIVDARYVLGKTFALLAHDLSTGEFFQKISENEAWTLPVEQEGDVSVMDGESALRAGIVTGAEWVRVPDTKIKKSQAKVYGALAGRVVRAEIFQDLNQLNKMQSNGIWKTIMTSFKLNKTARNPVVHFNNIMSNLVLMDMADVRFSDLYQAIVEMRRKGKIYEEAKINGAFGVSFAEQELKNEVLDKLIDEIHEATGTKPVGLEDIVLSMDSLPFNKQFAFMMKLLDGLWHGVDIRGKKVGLKQLDKKMLNYYQHEDEVFRMATYMRRRAQGMNAVEAGISARDQFLNYDISAPWINAARATVLPFISYTYRAVPIVAKSIAQRPWKLAKYFTIAYGMNAIGYALTGGDEEKERRSMRDEISGKLWIGADRLIRMPWNNEENNPYFWDVRRLIPVGDVFDMNQYHAALPIIPASIMPSGPIAMGFEFMLNKTGFFGEEIVDPLADDWVIGTQKTLDWMWKSYGPSAPWIPYSYYWDKMGIAMTGGRDRLGREYKILPALASSFGIKIAPHDVSYGVALKAMEIERSVEAVRHRLSFLEKDYWQRKINKAKYIAKRKRYIMRLQRLEEKARELVQ